MALAPLTVVGMAGFIQRAVPTQSLLLFLVEMVIWLGVSVAIAIYGSHKITVLREEAMAARQTRTVSVEATFGRGRHGRGLPGRTRAAQAPLRSQGDPARTSGGCRRCCSVSSVKYQVTATLTHPNTVQVFDYGQASDGTVFYAMEYLTGLSLEQLVSPGGPLPAGRTICVLRQICGALGEAHAIGLIHRDIKPSNVILCNRGGVHDVAKLLDFGLVRMQSTDAVGVDLTRAGLIFGTPAYMSPEQAAGRNLDARSDIYSLGALAYFLVTGQPPFVRDSVVQVLAAHINEPVRSLRSRRPDVPQDLEASRIALSG